MKAKLQKQQAYKYKDKQHFKHVIVVPDEAITELCWKGGQELILSVKEGKLIVELSNENSSNAQTASKKPRSSRKTSISTENLSESKSKR